MVKKYARLVLFIAVVVVICLNFGAVMAVAAKVADTLIPIFVGLVLALVFNIPVTFLENKVFRFKKRKFARPLAIAVTYTVAAGLTALIFYLLLPQLYASVKGLAAQAPRYLDQANEFMSGVLERFGISGERKIKVIGDIKGAFSEFARKIAGSVPEAIEAVKFTVGVITETVFAVVLSVFMIAGKEKLIGQLRRFICAIFPVKTANSLDKIAKVSATVFSQFLGGQFFEALLLGTAVVSGMLILRLPYALLIGTLSGILNIIPLLGAYISAAVGFVIVAFVSLRSAVVFLIFITCLQSVEGNIIYPRVVGRSLGLSGFWVLSAVLIFGGLFGLWGIILGVPSVAVIYKLLGRKIGQNPTPQMLIPPILKKTT